MVASITSIPKDLNARDSNNVVCYTLLLMIVLFLTTSKSSFRIKSAAMVRTSSAMRDHPHP